MRRMERASQEQAALAAALFGAATMDLLGGCAGKPATEAVSASPAATAETTSVAPIDASPASPMGHATKAPEDAGGAAPPASGACATDMVFVDGEFCTELETHCLKSWYAEANKKTICERFQEPTR